MKKKGGKLVHKIFIVNVVLMHLSAIWQFWPLQRSQTSISWGAYELSYSGGLVQIGDKAQRWGFKSVRAPWNPITERMNTEKFLTVGKALKLDTIIKLWPLCGAEAENILRVKVWVDIPMEKLIAPIGMYKTQYCKVLIVISELYPILHSIHLLKPDIEKTIGE